MPLITDYLVGKGKHNEANMHRSTLLMNNTAQANIHSCKKTPRCPPPIHFYGSRTLFSPIRDIPGTIK